MGREGRDREREMNIQIWRAPERKRVWKESNVRETINTVIGECITLWKLKKSDEAKTTEGQ